MRLIHALPALVLALSVAAHAEPKKACDLITQQEAAATLGVPVQPGVAVGPTNCKFVAVSGDGQLTATVASADPRGTAMSMDMLVKSSSAYQTSVAVPGLGEHAVFSTDAGGGIAVSVLAQSTRVSVLLGRLPSGQDIPARRDALTKTAKLIISRL